MVSKKPKETQKLSGRSARSIVIEILKPRTTDIYDQWINGLKDGKTRARILVRVDRLCSGNPGDFRNLTDGVSELKLDFGPGFRVYYTIKASEVVILLVGGTKSSQASDIAKAIELARNL
jgi:putative addiction module killer protein